MNPKKDVTIYDIAKQLNISTSTVSRALQNHPAINKLTKKKVIATAKEIGYQYNTFAGNLRKKSTSIIGVMVHELNSNFITSVLAGIEKVTSEAGYDIIIAHSSESYTKESANALNLFHKRVDGLIASLAYDTKNLDHYLPFHQKGIPVVFFDRVEPSDKSTVVVIDNTKCGYQATKHLIEQGCKRIAHITGNLSRNVYAHRFQGYKKALTEHHLPFDKKLLIVNDLGEEAARNATLQLLRLPSLPDGIFITNDFTAAVVIQTLKENGIVVPDDIAIVGFNNDAISKLIEPKITTINYPGIEMGEIAARQLIANLKGEENVQLTNTIIIRSDLIIRESSLKKHTPLSIASNNNANKK
ncbi:LacI family DNA-binding transcriptional regulator [Hydrotalea sandarakina]|jgi:LacI family transcriptional regulator|uniref:LacI family transcriptional regulator n=1 Tax=Hydrotalea sandarakina TaxID=1004304 RepID=A0A2W7RLZ7_9BACT|nr:LacI family DNA-binding transcriptional regulator [Hydrotalea sandarakina]PZX61813.1 LacI family transcriptional regulator [Hydrotalea sandarakina]